MDTHCAAYSRATARLSSAAQLRQLRRHLQRGGVVAYPTEACFGLGVLPGHRRGLQRLIRLKQRPQHKGLIVIGATWTQLKPWLKPQSDSEVAQLNVVWQSGGTAQERATTVVLPAAERVLPLLRGRQRACLAVRLPAHNGARVLCQQIGSALVSTSANRAKERPCTTAREVWRRFGSEVKLVKARCGQQRQPSRILDWQSRTLLR